MKDKNPRRLVQVTTVPLSFCLLRGQAEFLKERGFVMHGISSPGEALKRYALAEDVAVHAVEMPRRITPLRDLLRYGESTGCCAKSARTSSTPTHPKAACWAPWRPGWRESRCGSTRSTGCR